MQLKSEPEIIFFKNISEWELWLAKNYMLQIGVFIKIAKKNSGIESIAIAEALDTALCYGWIDGIRKSFDESFYLQKYTPRRAKSLWSKINVLKIEALSKKGMLKPTGIIEIEKAKADGRWDSAYESQKNAVIPPDLEEIFKLNTKARDNFDTLDKTNKYAVLWRLMTSKDSKIRKARLEKIVAFLESGKKFY